MVWFTGVAIFVDDQELMFGLLTMIVSGLRDTYSGVSGVALVWSEAAGVVLTNRTGE